MELVQSVVPMFLKLVDLFLHLDVHLRELVTSLGGWTYGLLFVVIFAETGLVVTPFLPGDSLLFAVGAIAAFPDMGLNLFGLIGLMFVAAVLGDAVNYSVGRYLGPRVFKGESSFFLNQQHLHRTKTFYDRHGGKTIIIARFIPIVRTFAPFVAGIGHMGYAKFARYNVMGAFLWVLPFCLAGYFFGNLPFVQKSFHYVILGIIVVSLLPALYEFMKARSETKLHGKPLGQD